MSTAAIDLNTSQTITALLNTNGSTITRITADAATHGLSVVGGTTGSNNGGDKAFTDENNRPTLFAVSSADGVTPVALYVDSTGHLLIQSL